LRTQLRRVSHDDLAAPCGRQGWEPPENPGRFTSSVIAYHVLRDGQSYRELGGDYFDHLNPQRLTRYQTKRLAALGYVVTLTKSAA